MGNSVRSAFMDRAIHLAVRNVQRGRGGPFGCVIVHQGRILAEGANAVTATNDPTAHAEVVALRAACRRLKSFQLAGCDVYTSCEPCPMCMGALYWARPRAVYYCATAATAARAGFDDSFFYSELRRPAGRRALPMIRLLPEQARAPFLAWQRAATRVEY